MARGRGRGHNPFRGLNAQAQRMLDAYFAPMENQIKSKARGDIAGIEAANAAAARLLGQSAPDTQRAYDLAAKETAGFGGAFSGSLGDVIRQGQEASGVFGARQGADTPPGQVVPSTAHDTLYYGEGFNPASGLEAQGAAAGAYASELPGLQSARGAEAVRGRQQQENQDLLDLAAKRPEMLNQILDELWKREVDKANLAIKQQAQDLYASQFGETVRHHQATEAQANLNYQEQVRAHSAAIDRAKQKGQNPNSALSKTYGYIVDSMGNPILDANGNKIPVAQNGAGGGKGTNSKAYQKAVAEALDLLGSPIERGQGQPGLGKYVARKGKSEFSDGSTNNPKNAVYDYSGFNFRQAQNYLVDAYGISRKQARRALIKAGWPPPAAADNRYASPGRHKGGRPR